MWPIGVDQTRAKIRDHFRVKVQDFTDRVNAEWATASPEDVDVLKEWTARLSRGSRTAMSTRLSRRTTWTRGRSGEGCEGTDTPHSPGFVSRAAPAWLANAACRSRYWRSGVLRVRRAAVRYSSAASARRPEA